MSKLVRQEDEFGCGAACLAMAAGLSYKQALELFSDGKVKAGKKGFLCKDICDVLGKAGKNYSYCYVTKLKRRKIYKEGSIVFIRRSKNNPYGHYLYRDKDCWIDPWTNRHENEDIKKAKARKIKRLEDKPIYLIFPN